MPTQAPKPITVFQAAKLLCEESNWEYTNLELQKILYICHMFYLGHNRRPLLTGEFQAWDYGPVHPTLYSRLSRFGADSVDKSAFIDIADLDESKFEEEIKMFKIAANKFPHPSGPQLIALTHSKEVGAWRRLYKYGKKGIVMYDDDIIEEYGRRIARQSREEENKILATV